MFDRMNHQVKSYTIVVLITIVCCFAFDTFYSHLDSVKEQTIHDLAVDYIDSHDCAVLDIELSEVVYDVATGKEKKIKGKTKYKCLGISNNIAVTNY